MKSQDGPFTSSEKVLEHLTDTKDIEKNILSRLKKEVQYAKYRARKIEKNNSLFKLMNIFKKIKNANLSI